MACVQTVVKSAAQLNCGMRDVISWDTGSDTINRRSKISLGDISFIKLSY